MPGQEDAIIIAPEHFLEEAALENAIAGDAMARRSTYQYGTFLEVAADGIGKIDAGLGKDIQRGGKVGFAVPTYTVFPNLDRDIFARLLMGITSVEEAINKNYIVVGTGQAEDDTNEQKQAVIEFFNLFDASAPNFRIVQP